MRVCPFEGGQLELKKKKKLRDDDEPETDHV
jgi:hypothetical protein